MTGKVIVYHPKRGYGWLERDSDHSSLYFHISNVEHKRILLIGSLVEFDTAMGSRGEKAVNIRPLDTTKNPSGEHDVESPTAII